MKFNFPIFVADYFAHKINRYAVHPENFHHRLIRNAGQLPFAWYPCQHFLDRPAGGIGIKPAQRFPEAAIGAYYASIHGFHLWIVPFGHQRGNHFNCQRMDQGVQSGRILVGVDIQHYCIIDHIPARKIDQPEP